MQQMALSPLWVRGPFDILRIVNRERYSFGSWRFERRGLLFVRLEKAGGGGKMDWGKIGEIERVSVLQGLWHEAYEAVVTKHDLDRLSEVLELIVQVIHI